MRNRAQALLETLPPDPAKLLHQAIHTFDDLGGPENNQDALILAGRSAALDPLSAEAWFVAGRSCAWLWEYGQTPYIGNRDGSGVLEAECVDLARRAVKLVPNEARYHYSLAIAMGLSIQRASVVGIPFKLAPFLEVLRAVVDLDETLEEGGPLRMLGTVYLKAPAWPAGPGDLDAALELLERAVTRFPDHPLNHMFYAEALLQDDRRDEAIEHIEKAYELCSPLRFGWRTEGYLARIGSVRL
jgi:tetratricopeptide (TPR) repeat protein